MNESRTDRIVRLITERRDTISDIKASHDLTSDEKRDYRDESTQLANLSIAVKNFGYDGLGDRDQDTIDGLIEQEDENLRWS